MALTANERQGLIQYLTTNCETWKCAGDAHFLASLPDEKLALLKSRAEHDLQAVAVANAAAAGFQAPDGNQYRVNPTTGRWERAVVNAGKKKTKNGKMMPDDEEAEMMPDDEEVEGEEETQNTPPPRGKKKPTANATPSSPSQLQRPRTVDEWLRSAPVEVQNTVRYAKQIEESAKDQLIGELLLNVVESDRPAQREWLIQQSLEQLHKMKSLLPRRAVPEKETRAPARNTASTRRAAAHDGDVLELPRMPWEEMPQRGSEQTNGTYNSGEELPTDGSEEEWLAKAPAGLQSTLRNAMAIEQRERERLIEEITANVDEEAADRLRLRLRGKSLEEIRDFRDALGGRREAPKPFFGGAAAAPSLAGVRIENAAEDVLPLPSMDWTKIS